MKYAVNDNVIHPHHGAGVVTSLEDQEFVEGFMHYYVINIPGKDMTVRIPVRKADKIGIRPAISLEMLEQVMIVLQSEPESLPDDFKERQVDVRQQINSGEAALVAEVIRDLTWHQRRKHLSKTDSDLLKGARDILGSEIAAVTGADSNKIQKDIDEALIISLARMDDV